MTFIIKTTDHKAQDLITDKCRALGIKYKDCLNEIQIPQAGAEIIGYARGVLKVAHGRTSRS